MLFFRSKLVLNRNMLFLPCFLSKKVYIHNGKMFKKVVVLKSMLFKTVGSLFFSKKKQSFKVEKKKKK